MKRLAPLLPLLALAPLAAAHAEDPATNAALRAQIVLFPGEPAVLITDRMNILDDLCAEMEGGGATESLLAGCSPAGVRVNFRASLDVPGLSSETWERFEVPWADLPTNLTITAACDLSKTIRVEPAGKDARLPRDSVVAEDPLRDEILSRFLGPGAPAAPDAAFELVHPYGAGAVRSTNLVWLAEFLPPAPDPASGRGRLLARVSGDFAEVFRTVDATGRGGRAHSRIDVCKVPLSALPATLDLPGGDYELRRLPPPGRSGPVAATLLGADGAVVHGPFVVACDPNGGPIQGTVPLRCAFLVRDWRSLHEPDILALETLDVEWKPGESGAPAFSIHRAASRGNGRAEEDWLSVERALPADVRLPWSGETLRFKTAAPGTPAANIVSDPVRIAIAPACSVPPRGGEPACLATPSEALDWKKEGAKPVVAGGTELYHLVERHPGGNITELHAHPCVDGIHLELRSLTPEARSSYIAWRLAPYDILSVDIPLPDDLGSVHLKRAPATNAPALHADSADGAQEPAP